MFMLDSEVEEFFQKKLKVTDHMVITLFATWNNSEIFALFWSRLLFLMCIVMYENIYIHIE